MGMLVGSGGLPVGDDCGTGVPLLHRGGPSSAGLWVRTGTRWPRGVVSAGLGGPWHEAGAGAVAPGLSVEPRC
jgi:hypothetical protein